MTFFLNRLLKKIGFSDFSAWLFIRELRLLKVRIFSLISLKQRIAMRHAKEKNGLKVNLACGNFANEGWIGIDSSFQSRADWYLDMRNGLPLPDQSCSNLFCEHFLEHLSYPEEVKRFLAECYRVLKMDGILRIIVPDAEKFVRAYAGGDTSFLLRASPNSDSPMEALNSIFYGDPLGEHRYAYDFNTLKQLLESAGFRNVEVSEPGKGSIASALDRQDIPRVMESFYVEATR